MERYLKTATSQDPLVEITARISTSSNSSEPEKNLPSVVLRNPKKMTYVLQSYFETTIF